MKRSAIVASALIVAVATAGFVLLASPSTGPDLARSTEAPPAPLPAVRVAEVPEAKPSPKPSRRVRPQPPVQGKLPTAQLVTEGPMAGRIQRPFSAGLRDRYSKRGHERAMKRIHEIAQDRDWDPSLQADVTDVMEGSQERARSILEEAAAGDDVDRADVAKQIAEVRKEELQQLEALLGEEAASVASKMGARPQVGAARGPRLRRTPGRDIRPVVGGKP